MRKQDLRTGMIVVANNGHSYIVMRDTGMAINDVSDKDVLLRIDEFGKWMRLSDYNEDLFMPDEWIEEVMEACENAPQHNYLFLTKNTKRYCEFGVPMSKNMWYGVTITKESDVSSFNSLPAGCNKFVSMEPLLEDLRPQEHNLLFRQVDWIIIGAETGRRKNKVIPERKWIEEIVRECRKAGVPVFMKSSLAELWGEALIREFPVQLLKH